MGLSWQFSDPLQLHQTISGLIASSNFFEASTYRQEIAPGTCPFIGSGRQEGIRQALPDRRQDRSNRLQVEFIERNHAFFITTISGAVVETARLNSLV